MATPIRATIIAVAILIVAAVAVAAQLPAAAPTGVAGSAPAPSLDCTNYLMNLSDCLTYVEEGSKLRKPDKGCCPELAGLVDSQPICLCQLLGSSETYGVHIDVNKALKLPTLCAVQTPPVSMCSEVGYPVRLPPSESPSSSMGAAMPLPPAAAPTGVAGSAPAPSLDCTNYLMNLSDCLTYVEEGSKLRKPDKGCCPELAGLVDSQPICLCQLLGSSETYGVHIDLNKALKLPTLCTVQTPPVSMCSEVGYPIRLPPSESPSSSMGGVPIASSPGPSRSSGNERSSGGIAISQLSFQFQRVGLFAISFLTMPFFY